MKTTRTLQSSLAFLGGLAGSAFATFGMAWAVSGLLMTPPTPHQACVVTIPQESVTATRPLETHGCGMRVV